MIFSFIRNYRHHAILLRNRLKCSNRNLKIQCLKQNLCLFPGGQVAQFRLDIHRCSLLGDSALLIILPLYLVTRPPCTSSWPLSQRGREKEVLVQNAPSLRRWLGSYIHCLTSHPFSPNSVMWQHPLHRALGNVPISRGALIKGVKDGRDSERLYIHKF